MFLFRKPKQVITPQDKREELLREFYLGNLEYSVRFDQKDMKMREYFLKRVISGGWLGFGVMGMGYFNFRLLSNMFPEKKYMKWGALGGFMIAGNLIIVSNYFKVKLESQEYLRQKYLAGPTPGPDNTTTTSN